MAPPDIAAIIRDTANQVFNEHITPPMTCNHHQVFDFDCESHQGIDLNHDMHAKASSDNVGATASANTSGCNIPNDSTNPLSEKISPNENDNALADADSAHPLPKEGIPVCSNPASCASGCDDPSDTHEYQPDLNGGTQWHGHNDSDIHVPYNEYANISYRNDDGLFPAASSAVPSLA